jgi:site-specific DNA-methyltransferase (adenine-specific)
MTDRNNTDLPTNEIFTGDNVAVLQTWPDACIDLVVTSPPYDNLRTYGGHSWDFEGVARELTRVLKPGGVIVWVVADATVNGSETLTSMRQAIHFKDVCGLRVHDTMIYQTNKPPLTHNRYEQAWEYMFVLAKGAPSRWNGIRVPSEYAGQKRCATMRQDSDQLSNRSAKGNVNETKLKNNVWYMPRSSQSDGADRVGHPATFPLALARDHILSWSNEGDIVLDPFAGSGTTCVAAKELRRRYVGIEVNPAYVEICERRLGNSEFALANAEVRHGAKDADLD